MQESRICLLAGDYGPEVSDVRCYCSSNGHKQVPFSVHGPEPAHSVKCPVGAQEGQSGWAETLEPPWIEKRMGPAAGIATGDSAWAQWVLFKVRGWCKKRKKKENSPWKIEKCSPFKVTPKGVQAAEWRSPAQLRLH